MHTGGEVEGSSFGRRQEALASLHTGGGGALDHLTQVLVL